MSKRFDEFAERWKRDVAAPDADLEALEQELMDVHAASGEEEERVGLLSLHMTFISSVANELAATKPDMIMTLLHHSLSCYHLMLREESLTEGQIDKRKLLRVTERELLAGRMKFDDPLRTYAEGGQYFFEDDMVGIFIEGAPDQGPPVNRLN